jgi:hypothetical protein
MRVVRGWLVVLTAVIGVMAVPALAQAYTWSGPVSLGLETSDGIGGAIACPSTSQCTFVRGPLEVTFNPLDSTSAAPPPTLVVDSDDYSLGNLNCPSTSYCVASDLNDHLVTFDPQTGDSTVYEGTNIDGTLACPLATECVTNDVQGYDVYEFDPHSPATERAIQVYQAVPNAQYIGARGSVTCPTANSCALLDETSAGTFDPLTATQVNVTDINPGDGSGDSMACTTDLCAAVGGGELIGSPVATGTTPQGIFTFDPNAPAPTATVPTQWPAGSNDGIYMEACADDLNCLADDMDPNGAIVGVYEFDPGAPASATQQVFPDATGRPSGSNGAGTYAKRIPRGRVAVGVVRRRVRLGA